MRIQRLLIPGRFQDSYLHRGWLIGLTDYRSFRFVRLSTASDQVLRFFDESAKRRNEFTTDGSNLGNVSRSLTETALPPEVLQIQSGLTREIDLVVDANVVLDLTIYKEDLYVGTDKGLFTARLELSRSGRRFHTRLERQHDAQAFKVTARFDTVTVSSGEQGLFCALRASEALHHNISLRRIENHSLRNAWMHTSLVNYPSQQEWELLPANEEGWKLGGEHWRVADFPENRRFGLSSLLSEIRNKKPDFEKDDVQFAFNSDRYIFLHTFDGEFFSLRLGERHGRPHVYFHRTHKGAGARILSAAPLGSGIVIETKDRVFLFAREQWTPLVNRDVLSIRTFQNSQRFRNIVSIATEDGLHLISVVPEKRGQLT